MQQERKTLSARLTLTKKDDAPANAPAVPKVFVEAIMLRMCVSATYNRTAIKMAPHIVYTKHDELFVDGVVVERDGNPPRELKLGTFKLAGLTELAPTIRPFTPMPLFDPEDAKYAGTTLAKVKF